jgi:opacity protein-like surface antigen
MLFFARFRGTIFMRPARAILLGSCSWLLLTAVASAADLPVRAAKAPPVLASSWAGFYLGLHGGYGWRDSDFSEQVAIAPLTRLDGIRSKGGVFGGHAGYNWQFGRAVTGLEFDFSGADIRGSNSVVYNTSPIDTVTRTFDDRVKYLGTARGRVGWLPTETVLLYGTAGLAWERYERTNTFQTAGPENTFSQFSRFPFDRFGWAAGAGVEAMIFGPHWIGRIEYLHYDFGRAESAFALDQGNGVAFTSLGGNQTIDVVRAGLSYKWRSRNGLRRSLRQGPGRRATLIMGGLLYRRARRLRLERQRFLRGGQHYSACYPSMASSRRDGSAAVRPDTIGSMIALSPVSSWI